MNKTFHVEGMHCASCELLMEKELKKIPGVKGCSITLKSGKTVVELSKNVSDEKIKNVIEQCGYSISNPDPLKNEKKGNRKFTQKDFFLLLAILAGGFILYEVMKNVNISVNLPAFGSKVGVLVALIIGFVASISTCLALVGGIVMGFGSVYSEGDEKPSLMKRLIPHLYFHAGRIGGFVFLGALLGLIGSKITYSLGFAGYLTMFVAIVLFYIGLHILNLVPNITRFGFHLPKSLSRKISDIEKNDHHLTPVILGLLTFFLPCGFTQSMQLAAVASGNPVTGGLIMGVFALGTLPVLLGVGLGSSYAKNNSFPVLKKFIGVLLLFFALYSFNSGLVLAGSSFTIDFWKNPGGSEMNTSSEVVDTDTGKKIQVVKMTVDYAFAPTEFTIKKGIPVRWEIDGVNISGCSSEVVIPKLRMQKKLSKGLNVIEFTPEEEGTIPFSCGMGMLTGKFTVVNDDSALTPSSATANPPPTTAEDIDSAVPAVGHTCGGSAGRCGGGCAGGCGGPGGNPTCSMHGQATQ